jgi:hypothetical protein
MLRRLLLPAVSVTLAATLVAPAHPQRTLPPPRAVVYKSPTCECCKKWEQHLRLNGFEVESHDLADVSPMKRELGVPKQLASCHTAVVGSYLVEGHVPAADIQRLLREKPPVVGLTAPGMPPSAPGMDTGHEPYDVLTFDARGRTTVWAKH